MPLSRLPFTVACNSDRGALEMGSESLGMLSLVSSTVPGNAQSHYSSNIGSTERSKW